MRPAAIAGLILVVLGILAIIVRSITYFSTDRVVGPAGFFEWNVTRPHTIFISPLAGIAALVLGIALLAIARRSSTV